MEPERIVVERCGRLDTADAERFAAIYEASFPACERAATAELLADVESGTRLCYSARDGSGLIGFAVVFELRGTSAAMLEYLAVAPGHRNGGVGGRLLEHLRSSAATDAGVEGVVLEVEPTWEVEGEERALRERRLGRRMRAALPHARPRARGRDRRVHAALDAARQRRAADAPR
jgi:ribosomal protein S18 acetylase RimI-like enzyme